MSINKYLKQKGLMPSTRGVYERVYANIDISTPQTVVDWLKGEIAKRQPMGTLLPKRAMAKHILVYEHNVEDEDADRMLPKLKGRAGKQREGLTNDQYDEYMDACTQLNDPIRTILRLLPLTGMRIAEICNLKSENIEQVGSRYLLKFRGKGDKERIVPLSANAWKILKTYLTTNGYMFDDGTGLMSGMIFETAVGTNIKPHLVRKYTRKIASERPILKGLSPHILRHTL